MRRKIDVWLLRVDDALGALFEGGFEEGYNVGGLGRQLVCNFFIV